MRLLFLACLLAVSSPATSQSTARLILPPDLSAPSVMAVRISGVAPGAHVTITVVQRPEEARVFTAQAVFIADRNGQIDTGSAAPLTGTYAGPEPLGLFWSGIKRPAGASDPALGYAQVTADLGAVEVARGMITIGPDAARLTISSETPFPGAVWARPADGRRHPVVIVLGGSEGGSSTAREMAPLFAARGYATLGLPYYDPVYSPSDRVPGLPRSFTDIPVDRLVEVRRWLKGQPDADADRIGLWGVSKGSEFALIAASNYTWIKAVVAVVPSDLVWEGWGKPGTKTASFSLNGRPLPFEPYADMDAELAKAARGERMDMRHIHEAGRSANPGQVAAARIPVEKFHGPLLLIAAGRDTIWPSAEMAANIAATRARRNEPTQVIVMPLASHFLGGQGTVPAASLVTPGSDASSIAHARAEGWAATFAVFKKGLGSRG